MIVGFIGLGNLGSKLADTLIRNNVKTFVHDLKPERAGPLLERGGFWAERVSDAVNHSDIVVTCLPSPKISAEVIERKNGVFDSITTGKIWIEMSTTHASEVVRIARKLEEKNVLSADCPVSGGCHRAETGNISIFAGCERQTFEKIKNILFIMGHNILHTGPLGTASQLKVMTNFLATTNLVACCEALTTMRAANIDLAITYEAIKISSGNSFVHETESQVILNGSRDINFTLDLVLKDIKLFQELADRLNIPLDISPLLNNVIARAIGKLGPQANSPSIVSLLEEKTGFSITSPGFPSQIDDSEPETLGFEVFPRP